jgi:4-alpha-glucanotransferase
LRRHAIDRHDLYAVAEFLARTKSRLFTLSLEDLLGLVEQPNIPGTIDEHPNWRRRLPVSIEQIASAIDMRALKLATRERSRTAV